jgi:hypothetical protein
VLRRRAAEKLLMAVDVHKTQDVKRASRRGGRAAAPKLSQEEVLLLPLSTVSQRICCTCAERYSLLASVAKMHSVYPCKQGPQQAYQHGAVWCGQSVSHVAYAEHCTLSVQMHTKEATAPIENYHVRVMV